MTYLARWCYLTFLFAVFGACYHCYLLSLVFAAVDSPDRTFVLEALQRQPSLFCNCDIGGFQEDRDVSSHAGQGSRQEYRSRTLSPTNYGEPLELTQQPCWSPLHPCRSSLTPLLITHTPAGYTTALLVTPTPLLVAPHTLAGYPHPCCLHNSHAGYPYTPAGYPSHPCWLPTPLLVTQPPCWLPEHPCWLPLTPLLVTHSLAGYTTALLVTPTPLLVAPHPCWLPTPLPVTQQP